MRKMEEKAAEFLEKQRVAILSVVLPTGEVHGAAMHFAVGDRPLKIYFSTEKGSLKYAAVAGNGTGEAGVVVGFSEAEWVTLQMRGKITEASGNEAEVAWGLILEKYPGAASHRSDKSTVLVFVPGWCRYSNLAAQPPEIITAQDL